MGMATDNKDHKPTMTKITIQEQGSVLEYLYPLGRCRRLQFESGVAGNRAEQSGADYWSRVSNQEEIMSWVCGRAATDEDYELLDKRARQFIARHELDVSDFATRNDSRAWGALEDLLDCESSGYSPEQEYFLYLARLWRNVINRAIGDDGIAHGYIGHSGD